MLALVLGGGNALGAYHGGVITALAAAEVEPAWVAGSSIGAIMGALIAGNPPERRVAAAREFWRRGAQPDAAVSWAPERWRRLFHAGAALQARITGRPQLYVPRLAELLGIGGNPGLYDAGPMRRAISELVDFDRLNSGAMRLTALAVDVETGREAAFDTARGRVELDHLMASAALLPDYPAVEVDGRAYVDGGMAANVPADLVLDEPPSEALSCFVADLFTTSAPRPRRLGEANERQSDLIFAKQTDRTLRAMQQVWSLRQDMAPGAVYRLEYEYQQSEAALKSFDFSQSSLDRRWQRGEADMGAALALWRASPPAGTGLTIHPPVRREAR